MASLSIPGGGLSSPLSADLDFNSNSGTNLAKGVFEEGASASTPATDEVALYAKSGGKLYIKDDTGFENVLTTGTITKPSTKGDLVTYSSDQTTLGVGSNDQVLTADSEQSTGLKWATPAADTSGWELIETKYQSSGTTLSITVPAGTLSADGDFLKVEAEFESTASNQTQQLKFDSTVFAAGNGFLASGGVSLVTGRVLRTGATAQRTYGFSAAGTAVKVSYGTDASTLSGATTILADWATAGTNKVISLSVWKVSI